MQDTFLETPSSLSHFPIVESATQGAPKRLRSTSKTWGQKPLCRKHGSWWFKGAVWRNWHIASKPFCLCNSSWASVCSKCSWSVYTHAFGKSRTSLCWHCFAFSQKLTWRNRHFPNPCACRTIVPLDWLHTPLKFDDTVNSRSAKSTGLNSDPICSVSFSRFTLALLGQEKASARLCALLWSTTTFRYPLGHLIAYSAPVLVTPIASDKEKSSCGHTQSERHYDLGLVAHIWNTVGLYIYINMCVLSHAACKATSSTTALSWRPDVVDAPKSDFTCGLSWRKSVHGIWHSNEPRRWMMASFSNEKRRVCTHPLT